MKRTFAFCLFVLLAFSMLFFWGCTAALPTRQPETVKSFPKDIAPSQVVKTQNQWVTLNSSYGSGNYTISVSDNLDTLNTIYSVNDVSIWYFEASDNAVVWCEKSNGFITFKIYTFENQIVETISQISTETGFQPQNIGVFRNFAYYCTIDYAQQTVRILAYNIETKTEAEFYTAAFSEENQPYSIHLDNGSLCFVCSDQIKVFDLYNNETIFEAALPSDTKHVFGVSYDSLNDTCALYYADSDSEDIGILKEGDTAISSVYTFSKNHYAYQDKLECYDGHIYWILQANVSGAVADHYKLVDYHYLTHKPIETRRSFDFCLYDGTLYTLRFNQEGDYTHIDLGQSPMR